MSRRPRRTLLATGVKKASAGTKRRYTMKHVCDAITRAHGITSLAAQELGCSPNTVRGYISRYPTVAASKHQATEGMLDIAEAKLFQAIANGEAWGVIFYLKCKGKQRGYIERQEITGADGSPVVGPTNILIVAPNGEKIALGQYIKALGSGVENEPASVDGIVTS